MGADVTAWRLLEDPPLCRVLLLVLNFSISTDQEPEVQQTPLLISMLGNVTHCTLAREMNGKPPVPSGLQSQGAPDFHPGTTGSNLKAVVTTDMTDLAGKFCNGSAMKHDLRHGLVVVSFQGQFRRGVSCDGDPGRSVSIQLHDKVLLVFLGYQK